MTERVFLASFNYVLLITRLQSNSEQWGGRRKIFIINLHSSRHRKTSCLLIANITNFSFFLFSFFVFFLFSPSHKNIIVLLHCWVNNCRCVNRKKSCGVKRAFNKSLYHSGRYMKSNTFSIFLFFNVAMNSDAWDLNNIYPMR